MNRVVRSAVAAGLLIAIGTPAAAQQQRDTRMLITVVDRSDQCGYSRRDGHRYRH